MQGQVRRAMKLGLALALPGKARLKPKRRNLGLLRTLTPPHTSPSFAKHEAPKTHRNPKTHADHAGSGTSSDETWPRACFVGKGSPQTQERQLSTSTCTLGLDTCPSFARKHTDTHPKTCCNPKLMLAMQGQERRAVKLGLTFTLSGRLALHPKKTR